MKLSRHFSCLVVISLLLLNETSNAQAVTPPAAPEAVALVTQEPAIGASATEQQQQQQQQQQAQDTANQAKRTELVNKRLKIKLKNASDLRQSSEYGWAVVKLSCSDPTTNACAAAAIQEANMECTESGKFFRRQSDLWKWVNFSLILSSSIFTGLGASSTLANAKIFSTLGASTALGSVATTATTNSTSSEVGLASTQTAITNFRDYITKGGPNGTPAPNEMVYKVAATYAGQCTTAATAVAH